MGRIQYRENNYVVDEHGRVFSRGTKRWLRPSRAPLGYLQVQVFRGGRRRAAYVHHLVAEAYLGCRPPGAVINHKNGLKVDNHARNLCYCTQKQNMQHANERGLLRNTFDQRVQFGVTKILRELLGN